MERLRLRRALPLLATLVAVTIGLLALSERPDHARAVSPLVTLSPSMAMATAGNELSVDIVVADAPETGAYEFHLAFAPNVLEFDSVENGPFIESTGRDALCVGPNATHLAENVVSFGCGTLGAGEAASGGGVLATVTFSTSCEGTSALSFVTSAGPGTAFEPVSLSTVLGSPIPTDSMGGSATVTGGEECPTLGAGDANCSGGVDAIDAALMLQFNAGLLDELLCQDAADVNGDGSVDAIDAALVLQFGAGLLDQLPP